MYVCMKERGEGREEEKAGGRKLGGGGEGRKEGRKTEGRNNKRRKRQTGRLTGRPGSTTPGSTHRSAYGVTQNWHR